MASKYRQRLLQSSGVSNQKVQSEFGMKMMMKYGWTEGKGLGKKQTGIVDCVQVKRRQDNLGLGVKGINDSKQSWNDSWWNDAFNNSIKKLNIKKSHGSIETTKHKKQKKPVESDSSSEDSSDDSSVSSTIPQPRLGKEKKIHKHKKSHKKE